MWIAVAFSAIALTGVEFMVWFLLGLLRERALSAYRWMFLVRGGRGNPQQRPVLSDIYFHEDCGARKANTTITTCSSLENESCEKVCSRSYCFPC